MRTLWLAVAGLSVALYVAPLAVDIPLLDPDEGLHAAIAQEMVEYDDWVTPRFDNQAFYDKPILFFWAQAASLEVIGMTEDGVRLPGLLFALLGALTTGLLARRLIGPGAGSLATLFQMSMVLPVALGQFAVHDVALVPWVNLALVCFWEATTSTTTRRAWSWYAGAGLWLGLAILTKGLIGPAFVLMSYGAYLSLGRHWSRARLGGMLLAMFLAVVVASPWYAMMMIRHSDYAYYYFVERHLHGFFTSSQRHGDEPWWYYFPIMLGGALPWVTYIPLAWRQWRLADRSAPAASVTATDAPLLVWCWIGSGLLFLTLAQSKMVTYALPLFPPLAILVSGLWVRFIDGTLEPSLRRWMAWTYVSGSWLGPLILPISLLVVADRFDIAFSPFLWAVGIAISLGSWAPLIVWHWGRPQGALAASGLYLAAVFAFVMTGVMPQLAPRLSARALARYVDHQSPEPREVLVVNERVGSLVFYLTPEARHAFAVGAVRHVSLKDLLGPAPMDEHTLVALPTRMVDEARRCRRIAEAPLQEVGHYHVCDGRQLAPYLQRENKPAPRVARGN